MRQLRILSIAAVLAAFFAASASAGTIVLQDSFGNPPGGEFRAEQFSGNVPASGPNVLAPASKFQTFCLEYTENFQYGTMFNYAVNTGAVAGGVSGGSQDLSLYNGGFGTGDPLDAKTAYLYTQFWYGTLTGYDYVGAGRLGDGTELQQVIWAIEGEFTLSSPTAQQTGWLDEASNAVNFGSWGNSIGNVRVLNLTYTNGNRAQDQLVMVPVPPAVWGGLSLMGLMGIKGFRRQRLLKASE